MPDEIENTENGNQTVENNEEPTTDVVEHTEQEVTNKDLLEALNNLPEALARAIFCFSRPNCSCNDNTSDDETTPTTPNQDELTDEELLTVKNNTIDKVTTARLDYEDAINYLKQVLILNNCYSEYDVKLYIGMDRKNDLMLTVKLRPFTYVGKCIQFFYDAFGEPEAFICSNHHMRMIMEYKLV